jgi:hypothetical protein
MRGYWSAGFKGIVKFKLRGDLNRGEEFSLLRTMALPKYMQTPKGVSPGFGKKWREIVKGIRATDSKIAGIKRKRRAEMQKHYSRA